MRGGPVVRIEHSTDIAAERVAVYALIAEPRRRPEWLSELRAVDAPPGPARAGDTFTGMPHAFLHEVIGRSEVEVAEPPDRLVEMIVIGVRIRSSWSLEETASGTRVIGTMDVEVPSGPLAPIERVVLRWWLGRMQKRSLGRLRDLVARA